MTAELPWLDPAAQQQVASDFAEALKQDLAPRTPMPWEPGYGPATIADGKGSVLTIQLPTGESMERIEQAIERVAKDALDTAIPQVSEMASSYARQYVSAVLAGKDPSLVPDIVVTTKTGQELDVASAKSRAWSTFLQGLGFDLVFALAGVLSMVGNFDLLHQAGWVALGALVAKTIGQTVASYVVRIKVSPKYRQKTSASTPLQLVAVDPVA